MPAILSKQYDFVASTSRETLFSGAFRAGKSYAACWKAIYRGVYPGARELLCRHANIQFRRSTLVTLNNILVQNNIPHKHNRTLQEIIFPGGGRILYLGWEKPGDLGSLSLTGCHIDEGTEVPESDYNYLLSRISETHPLGNQLSIVCNPGAPTHYLAKRFGVPCNSAPLVPNTQTIMTCMRDNTYLDEAYLSTASRMTGVDLQRYYFGRWIANEGLCYPSLLDCTVVPVLSPPDGENYAGLDYGYRDPACCLPAILYKAGDKQVLYVHNEFHRSGVTVPSLIQTIQAITTPDTIIFADHNDQSTTQLINSAGISCYNATKSIKLGVMIVNSMLECGQLYISTKCTNLLREAASYCWAIKEGLEAPQAKDDHAMDALRYLCCSLVSRNMMQLENPVILEHVKADQEAA